MIDALDYTLEQLLRRELDVDDDGFEISFSQPNGQWAARRTGRTVNLFLYDLRENPVLRRQQWQPAADQRGGPVREGPALFKRTPLMMDCFYLVTAWSVADDPARPIEEHRLLSRALRALAQYPVLNPPFVQLERAEALIGVGRKDERARDAITVEQRAHGQKTDEQDVLRREWLHEPKHNPLLAIDVEIRTRLAQHDVLANPTEIWSALEAQMKAGFSYVVTLPLDPRLSYAAERVLEQQMWFFPARRNAQSGKLEPIDPERPDRLYAMCGVIRDEAGVRQAGLRLHLLHDTAAEQAGEAAAPDGEGAAQHGDTQRYMAVTAADGEYRFSDLPAGTYTLLIHRPSGEVVVREFTLSAAGATGFDFTI